MNHISKFARFVFALALVLSALGFSASSVQADQPAHYEWVTSIPATFTDVCPFSVDVVSTYQVSETDFFDKDGALVRIHNHLTGQDVFTANGKTLVGEPYRFNVEFIFDSSGNLVHYYLSGVHGRIRLPDGGLFLTAGRTDALNHPDAVFIMTPDKGNMGNIAEFCTALAP